MGKYINEALLGASPYKKQKDDKDSTFSRLLVDFGRLLSDFGRLLDVLWSTFVAFGRHWAPKVAQRAKKLKKIAPTIAFWTPKMDTKTFIS